MIKDKSKKIKGCGKYAGFAETGNKAVLAKPPYSTKTWGMSRTEAQRHGGKTGDW